MVKKNKKPKRKQRQINFDNMLNNLFLENNLMTESQILEEMPKLQEQILNDNGFQIRPNFYLVKGIELKNENKIPLVEYPLKIKFNLNKESELIIPSFINNIKIYEIMFNIKKISFQLLNDITLEKIKEDYKLHYENALLLYSYEKNYLLYFFHKKLNQI